MFQRARRVQKGVAVLKSLLIRKVIKKQVGILQGQQTL